MSDLIDRDETIKQFCKQDCGCDPRDCPDKDLIHLQKEQAYMQGYADGQKPRKGKWIYGESENGNDGYYCSVCGNFVPWKYDEYDIDFIKEFLFCPKCGADMRGEQDE